MTKSNVIEPAEETALVVTQQDGDLIVNGFQLTPTGLVAVGTPTFEKWQEVGKVLGRAERRVQFWIGDWLNYGEFRWSESYAQAMEETGLAVQTLSNFKYIANAVKPYLREETLSFAHHSAVSALPPVEQKEYLQKAVVEDLSAEDLRTAIKKQKREEHLAALPPFEGTVEGNAADLWAIVNDDARNLLNHVPRGSVQLAFCSPPYNVGLEYNEHDDSIDPADYERMLSAVLEQCYGALETGGRIGVNVPYGVGRNPYLPLAPVLATLLTQAGFTLRGFITWDKGTNGNKTSWGSWLSPSNPHLRDETECLIVAHKISPDLDVRGAGLITEGAEFMNIARDMWHIPPESAERIKHPAPFPIELAERFIRFYGYAGCTVVDPFNGSGSTLIAALRLGCRGIGFDTDATYCALARERVLEELSTNDIYKAKE